MLHWNTLPLLSWHDIIRILGHDYSMHDYPIIMTLVLYSGFQVMIIVFRIQVMIISDLVLINIDFGVPPFFFGCLGFVVVCRPHTL